MMKNGKLMMKILNDVIAQVNYNNLYNHAISNDRPWRYIDTINAVDTKNYYFTSPVFEDYIMHDPIGFELCKPVFNALEEQNNHDIVIQRVKFNLYPSSQQLIEHKQHTDYKRGSACVYMLNECDGWTRVNQEKVPSIANTAVMFNSNEPHNSTNCTDSQVRLTININYI